MSARSSWNQRNKGGIDRPYSGRSIYSQYLAQPPASAQLCGALYGGEGSSGCSLRPASAGWSAGIRTARKRIKAFAPWKAVVPGAPEYGDQYSHTTSPEGVISKIRPCGPELISVRPLANLSAPETFPASRDSAEYVQIGPAGAKGRPEAAT